METNSKKKLKKRMEPKEKIVLRQTQRKN